MQIIDKAAERAAKPTARQGRSRSLVWMALLCCLAAFGPPVTAHAQSAAAAAPAVTVAKVAKKSVANTDDFTGRAEAIQSVDLVARVEDFLTDVNFVGGERVDVGKVLFQIEKAPYQAALAQATARLASANAALSGAEAELQNAETILKRQQTLVRSNTVSDAVLDNAVAARDQASAKSDEAKAQIDQANAEINTANLDLSYTTMAAPIAGQISKPLVTKGNLVSSRSGALATLVQLDPIRVGFAVPEALFIDLAQQAKGARSETFDRLFSPVIQLPNGKAYEHDGKVVFAGNVVDTTTGTVTVYADFPNPDGLLLPGAFVVVTVQEEKASEMLVIPASALLQDRHGPYVFTVDKDDTAVRRRITIAQRNNAEIAIQSGLSEGEVVIVQGIQKATAGQKVMPTAAPASDNADRAQAASVQAAPQSGGQASAN